MSKKETVHEEMSEKSLIYQEIHELYLAFDDKIRASYKRSLPFQDSLFDRWERAKGLGFGAGTSIYNSSFVYGNVSVGENVWIGPNTVLDGMGGLTIGNHCAISIGVQIYTHDTVRRSLSGGQCAKHFAPVTVGNNCHIAPNAVIIAGVNLGNQCLVAVNSFVNKSFGDNLIIAGTPAAVIGSVEVLPDGAIEFHYHKTNNRNSNK